MPSRSKRVKPAVNVEPIKDITAVNTALAELAGIKRQISDIETELNQDIDRLKKTAEAKSARLKTRTEALENGLFAFGEFNADIFAKKRTIELNFGSIGRRRATRVAPKGRTSWKLVLGKIKDLAFTEAIRTKETVNKDVLETWPDERLALIDTERKTRDVFWYEIKEEYLKGETQ